MPYQIFNRSDLKKNITCQFLTVQQDVIHHGKGNRVRIRIAFANNGGIAAIQIIDRYIRKSGQRVVNQTFITVCQFQVITRCCIGGSQTEFQPLLQLGIQVGTEAVTVKV